ncbi:MAG: folate-binding protein YgfZ [Cycloclasticus sp.]|nr:folate-binding protein YgfZ [Cycloclasticus sp.]
MDNITLYDLSKNKSIIAFSGSDADTFLQGQVSCDVLNLAETNTVFGSLCNPKGRVICVFHLFKRLDIYYMVLSSTLSKNILKRLKMFVFRSDVLIEDVSENHYTFGARKQHVKELIDIVETFAVVSINSKSDLTILIINKKYIGALEQSNAISISEQLSEWNHALISECIPDITSDSSELFIPQMLNLDALEAVDFKKGCYTGQEVIARLHYKGTSKRRLVIYTASEAHAPAEAIHAPNDSNSIGTILNCNKTSNNDYTGLVVLKIEYMKEGLLVLDNAHQLSIKLAPYRLD